MDLKLLKKKNQSEETDNCRLRQKWKFWKKKSYQLSLSMTSIFECVNNKDMPSNGTSLYISIDFP